jgi:hypothetical protein
MKLRKPALAIAGLIAAAAGCSSSKTGTLSLHLVDAPGDYQEINLQVLEVEVHSDVTGWTTLSKPGRSYDLLKLRGGVFATLASGVALPAGDYSQVRLLLGAGNTVRLDDGTLQPLDVPSGLQSGLKIVCPTRIREGAAHDLFIDFDGHKSIFLHGTGSGKYILRPVIRCAEKAATGSIAGQITSTVTEGELPLPDVTVTAQSLDALGAPTVVGTATTGSDGRYLLGLLPLGATYHVVTQPVAGGLVYAARASGPLQLTSGAPAAGFSVVYAATVPSGSVGGTISPTATASDADLVSAIQPLDAGGTTHRFVVRSAPAAVAGGVERYAMAALPVGSYSLSATRRTLSGGVETVTPGTPRDAIVTSGGAANLDLTVP